MPNELKPCPFCGGGASEETIYADNIPMIYIVGCLNDNCLIRPSTQSYTDIETARNAWNVRADNG